MLNINRPWNRQPSLTQSQHPAMLEFDFERNRRAGLDPDKITAGSNKMVHWICTKCPRGQPHLFMARPSPELATILVAPAVTTGRLASATHCSHCTLRWPQSMTLPGMVLDLSRFCQGPGKWPSGKMQVGAPGNKVPFSVPTRAGKA